MQVQICLQVLEDSLWWCIITDEKRYSLIGAQYSVVLPPYKTRLKVLINNVLLC